MPKPGRSGISRLFYATGYSIKGYKAAWVHEATFRQEVVLFCLLTPIAFWVAENTTEIILLIGSLFIVLIVELLNSAVEAIVDQVTQEYAELAGRAKDLGSAAVMLSILLVFVVWFLIAIF